MTHARVLAAMAGIVTALLLQAALVAPVSLPLPVSLPAVLVASVGLVDGPATGLAFGFATGLTADLGSHHPAGVLALCWLGLGLVSGLVADRRRLGRDALTAGVLCGVASVVATTLLAVVHAGTSLTDGLLYAAPTALADALLALAVLALVRRMLSSGPLRARQPVLAEFGVGGPRG